MALKALIIRQPWIGMILRGEKTWEMRNQRCTHRGLIALIEQGTGTVVGTASVVDDLPPLTEAQLRAHRDKHGIPEAQFAEMMARGWVRPWVLADVQRLPRPVHYVHPSGAVKWVNLSADEEVAILASCGKGDVLSARVANSDVSVTAEHPAMARRVLREVENTADVKIPSDASTSIRRSGNKLYIDVEWDDDLRVRRKRTPAWAQGVGTLAALVCMFSQAAFVIHFILGMMSSNISALSAFKWVIPIVIGAFTAELFGKGRMLRNESRAR